MRYCARPPFAMDRLRQQGSDLVYRCAKQHSEPIAGVGARQAELVLSPLELIDRIAALVPPARIHRHRYFGVLAPNSPLRAAVTAMAQASPTQAMSAHLEQIGVSDDARGPGPSPPTLPVPSPPPVEPEPVLPKHSPARYLWAALIARIYEVFPLLCPMCGGQMCLIAFITEGAQIRKILEHIGVDSQPPRIAPARGPPLWEDCDAQMDDAVQVEPDWGDWDLAAQVAPDFADQRVNW